MEEDIVVLRDENGEETEFELLDVIEYQGEEYAVLYPADGGEEELVHIFRIMAEDLDAEEARYEGLDDEELIETLYRLFRKRNGL
jgi:uncharacterized protein YrzB (UPF0473 family)